MQPYTTPRDKATTMSISQRKTCKTMGFQTLNTKQTLPARKRWTMISGVRLRLLIMTTSAISRLHLAVAGINTMATTLDMFNG